VRTGTESGTRHDELLHAPRTPRSTLDLAGACGSHQAAAVARRSRHRRAGAVAGIINPPDAAQSLAVSSDVEPLVSVGAKRNTASTLSNATTLAWYVNPAFGTTSSSAKTSTSAFACVR
jgi:hypothetical protein